jgi:hypothetical protein
MPDGATQAVAIATVAVATLKWWAGLALKRAARKENITIAAGATELTASQIPENGFARAG